ncbi:MAG: hypothetical protein ACLTLW_05915, partial [Sutterella wadsworthensis]
PELTMVPPVARITTLDAQCGMVSPLSFVLKMGLSVFSVIPTAYIAAGQKRPSRRRRKDLFLR